MPNTLEAKFYRRRAVKGLKKVTIKQKFGNHTLAFLDYRISNKWEYLLPPETTPISVRWGDSGGVKTYYGYVNHHETNRERGLTHVRMVLQGTSRVMNTTRPSSWEETTASSVVREIAKRHNLSTVVHNHDFVMSSWATGTRTDFQSLKVLAQETGYLLWVDGPNVFFMDPLRLFRTASTMTMPRIRTSDIREATVLRGSNIPGATQQSTYRVQYGLDYGTNEFFSASSGNPSNPTEVMNGTVTALSEAQDIADARDRIEKDHLVFQARVRGDAGIRPGQLINVDPANVNRDQGGVWMVTEATHVVSGDKFETRLVATRGLDYKMITRVPTLVRGVTGDEPAVVRDGLTWEAALQEHAYA